MDMALLILSASVTYESWSLLFLMSYMVSALHPPYLFIVLDVCVPNLISYLVMISPRIMSDADTYLVYFSLLRLYFLQNSFRVQIVKPCFPVSRVIPFAGFVLLQKSNHTDRTQGFV